MCRHVLYSMCADMCIDMCIDMGIDMCTDVYIGMCIDMCIGMCRRHFGYWQDLVIKAVSRDLTTIVLSNLKSDLGTPADVQVRDTPTNHHYITPDKHR